MGQTALVALPETALSLTMACCLDRRSTAMAAEVAVAETLEM